MTWPFFLGLMGWVFYIMALVWLMDRRVYVLGQHVGETCDLVREQHERIVDLEEAVERLQQKHKGCIRLVYKGQMEPRKFEYNEEEFID